MQENAMHTFLNYHILKYQMQSRCYYFSTSIHGQRRLSSQQKRSTAFSKFPRR